VARSPKFHEALTTVPSGSVEGADENVHESAVHEDEKAAVGFWLGGGVPDPGRTTVHMIDLADAAELLADAPGHDAVAATVSPAAAVIRPVLEPTVAARDCT
jgi:hypothetical protein